MKHSVPRKCAGFNFVAGCEKRSCINMGALLLGTGKYPPPGGLPQAGTEGPKPNN